MTPAIIFIVILTSALTSMLVGRFYLNWQYHESNSGYRQGKIMEATLDLVNAFHNKDLSIAFMRTKHRNSFGLIFERFLLAFGTGAESLPLDHYPMLYNEQDASRWDFYDEHVKPIIYDLNNNGFIGWIPWILNVKRMKTLWHIAHTLEEAIVIQETLRILETKNNVVIFRKEGESLVQVQDTSNVEINAQAARYKSKMNDLAKYWRDWLTLCHVNDLKKIDK